MIFKNVENECLELKDGRKVWLSRAAAVVATILVEDDSGTWYVPMVKRGKGVPDEVGKWVMPCGYLDWNETLAEACIREVFEETGLNLNEMSNSDYHYYHNDHIKGQPSYIASNPSGDAKENLSAHFVFAASIGERKNFPKFDINLIDLNGETAALEWISFTKLAEMEENGQIGFGHYSHIIQFSEMIEA